MSTLPSFSAIKGLVLEIGSGNNPNPRADILCDRYITTNHERAGEFSVVIDRPMVVADGYTLPFPDKSFDYVICSHIFEHMDDPKAFAKEVMRVGKAGYIEVPSDLSERLFGWDFHHWYCSLRNKTLVMRKKKEGVRYGGFFHKLIAHQLWFRAWFEKHESKHYIHYEWKDRINIHVDNKYASDTYIFSLDATLSSMLNSIDYSYSSQIAFYISWIARRIDKKTKKIISLFQWNFFQSQQTSTNQDSMKKRIVCPLCKGPLEKHTKSYRCISCKTTYPVYKSIPILLSPQELKKGY